MASLTLRKKIYYITYRVNGQPRRRSTGCSLDDRIGAEIQLREFSEATKNTGQPPQRVLRRSLTQHVEAFFAYQKACQLTLKQASGNRMRILRVLDLTGVSGVDGLTETRVQTVLAGLRRKPSSPKKSAEEMPLLSPRSRNTYLVSILAFLNWMVRNKYIPSNPLASLRRENTDVDVRHPRTAFTEEELILLYTTAKSSDRVIEGVGGATRALAYIIAAATGLRKSELASLTEASFHFAEDHSYVVVEAACSKRRRRDIVPLAAHIVPVVKEAIAKISPGEHLFPHFKTRKTQKLIKADLAACGLAYQTPDGNYRDWHSLRHSYITRVWRTGASAHIVKELARHTDLRLTLRYSHSTPSELQAAVDAIPDLGAACKLQIDRPARVTVSP